MIDKLNLIFDNENNIYITEEQYIKNEKQKEENNLKYLKIKFFDMKKIKQGEN